LLPGSWLLNWFLSFLSLPLTCILLLLSPPSLLFIILAASSLEIFSHFFHFVLLFWNQILTWKWLKDYLQKDVIFISPHLLLCHPKVSGQFCPLS
jgi:hypothetical protein